MQIGEIDFARVDLSLQAFLSLERKRLRVVRSLSVLSDSVWILNIDKIRKAKWLLIHLLAKKDAEAVGDNAAQPTATKMPSSTRLNGFGAKLAHKLAEHRLDTIPFMFFGVLTMAL